MRIGILFSYGISLQDWNKTGLIDRELEIYNKLSKHHEVTLITFGNENDLRMKKKLKNLKVIPIYKFIKKRNKYINFLFSFFLPIILRNNFKSLDILKCNQMWGSWIAVTNKIFNKKKFILRCGYEMYQNELNNNNNSLKKKIYFLMCYIGYIFSDKIIVTTKDIKRFVIKKYNIKSKKIQIIPNFINIKKFKSIRQKKLNDCLFVGRLSEEKNLFKVFDFLRGTKQKLFIIGNGKLKKELLEYKRKSNINVIFLKNVKNDALPKFYNRNKFFILLSKFEGNPKALLEAMSCGCICIVNKSQGIKNIVKNNYNGFFVKDKLDFSNVIKKIKDNQNIFQRISTNSQKFIKKNYSFDIIFKKELKVYK